MEKYVDMVSPFTGGKVKEFSTVEEHGIKRAKNLYRNF